VLQPPFERNSRRCRPPASARSAKQPQLIATAITVTRIADVVIVNSPSLIPIENVLAGVEPTGAASARNGDLKYASQLVSAAPSKRPVVAMMLANGAFRHVS